MLPAGSVTVAVITRPAGTATTNVPSTPPAPPASVFAVCEPMKTSPSPFVPSQAALWKYSTR